MLKWDMIQSVKINAQNGCLLIIYINKLDNWTGYDDTG